MLANTSDGIWGGFSSISWDSYSGYKGGSTDNFIFHLPNKLYYPVNSSFKAIYSAGNSGPVFGTGHDLFFSVNLASGYSSQGNYRTEPGKSSFTVIDIEVFRVT